MQWSDIPFHPSRKTLRQFAVLWVIAFGGLAAWQWIRHENGIYAAILLAVATLGIPGYWRPAYLRPIFVCWMIVAFPIGWTVSLVALVGLFYAVFTPLGLLFRLSGRDYLGLRARPDAESYWEPMTRNTDPGSYLNQF